MIDIENVSENNEMNDPSLENKTSENRQSEEAHEEGTTDNKTKKTFFKTAKKSNSKEIDDLKAKVSEYNDKYLRLSAEFDNYKKRTMKEKMEIMKAGGESVLLNILPVVDDFERAIVSINLSDDKVAIKQGIDLIYSKFKEFLFQSGIKEIDAKHQEFNTDLHEALTKIPAPEESLKGKVVDVIQKGYCLNDKVIRFSKVVIGE